MVDIHPDARAEINKITAIRSASSVNRRNFIKAGLGLGGTILGVAACDQETNTVTRRNDGSYDTHISGRNLAAIGVTLASVCSHFTFSRG